jgi:CAAX prenyl protease-like protein
MERRVWPYLAPYLALVGLAELGQRLPGLEAPLLGLRVALPALLVALAWRRGAYAELRAGPGRCAPLDVAFGVVLAALWIAPYLLWPALPRGEPFDPEALGPEQRALWLGLRLTGFVLVSPLVEELFVRSFLHRAAEAWPAWQEFGAQPVGRFAGGAFAVTVLWFTFSHVPWEWWVAAPTGALFNVWLYGRGRLASVWLAHATTNGAIAAAVLLGPWELWAFL